MHQSILIIDFGSQYTQLIARRVRELQVYCEIVPYNHIPAQWQLYSGIILSGSPSGVNQPDAPNIDTAMFRGKLPLLGVCYGAQLIAHQGGGKVAPAAIREYGRATINQRISSLLLDGLTPNSQVWMSHADTILQEPAGFEIIASTNDVACAAYHIAGEKTYGLQFHPEVVHSTEGKIIVSNFIYNICGCTGDWTPGSFIDETVLNLKQKLGSDKVILGLSGGVDSSVAAMLLSKAIGKNLFCIFVDNGLLRKGEFAQVLTTFEHYELNLIGVNAAQEFYDALKGVTDPEQKRKIIGRTFIEIFDREAHKIEDVKWLAQGTIYPDVIESVNVKGPSATIKSHHNVGGLPERMKLKIVEPLRMLFKDEVRETGKSLQMPDTLLQRHPFPGPGLGIRIIGDITQDKVKMLQEADEIFISALHKHSLYHEVWQAGVMLLPVQSVGVMGDERTYENCVALRAVTSIDGMTADWAHLPYHFLASVSNEIINKVKGINRVVYDISSKPPATIEWE
ncbi:MAG: glutamine-hydrolyzing GMP synthase [Bacteroidetes bacterium]|nr:glutamine-hydrolyzing GMP synthase [Bacteroidota bacterium]